MQLELCAGPSKWLVKSSKHTLAPCCGSSLWHEMAHKLLMDFRVLLRTLDLCTRHGMLWAVHCNVQSVCVDFNSVLRDCGHATHYFALHAGDFGSLHHLVYEFLTDSRVGSQVLAGSFGSLNQLLGRFVKALNRTASVPWVPARRGLW